MTISGRGLLVAGCSLALSPAGAQTRSPSGLRIRTSDYATDRAAFRTRLIVHGPAPQPHSMPSAPRGVREIDYPSGNLRLRAWIGLPVGAPERAPVVVFLHGGFAFSEEDYEMARPFLEAGYAVVMPSVRGENGQAGTFSMFFDEVSDVLAVTDYVRSQRWADPQGIYVAGHSAGGTLAMLAGLASPQTAPLHRSPARPTSSSWPKTGPTSCRSTEAIRRSTRCAHRSPTPRASRRPRGCCSAARSSSTGSPRGLRPRSRATPQKTWRRWRWRNHFNAVPEEISRAIAFFRTNA